MKKDVFYPPNYEFLQRERPYWNSDHYGALSSAENIKDLLRVATDVLCSMPAGPIGQVCGPISTGGYGSVEKNLLFFDATIQKLTDNDQIIFDQMPFEPKLHAFMKNARENGIKLNVLSEFYFSIFRIGRIKKLYFMHTWRSSEGAKWERWQVDHFRMEMIDLPNNFV